MKKIYFALILGLLYRQAAAKIEYHYNQLVFQNGSHPYVECAFSINPLSINYKTLADKKLQGQLTVTIYFKQNDQVIVFDKFGLMTNKFDSANAIIQDPAAILTVKHYQLKPGQYKVDVDVSDGISNEELKDLPLTVNYIDSKINLSSIELIDTFNQATDTLHQTFFKSGLLIYPYVIDYYPKSKNYLIFYSELYHPEAAGISGKFLAKFQILTKEKRTEVPNFTKTMVYSFGTIVPMLDQFNISNLESGNYVLTVSIINRQNEVLATQEVPFQRNNKAEKIILPKMNLDSIDYASMPFKGTFIERFTLNEIIYRLSSLNPIADNTEQRYIKNLISTKNEVYMKGFYYNFWYTHHPENMGAAINAYEAALTEVNNTFGTPTRDGFESDRGRVYLHYGAPNSIQQVKNDPDALPYEVWNYYDLPDQKNVIFVFYAPDRSNNDYVLIHSTARGERNDPKWAAIIQGSRPTGDFNNLDKSGYQRNSGSRLQDIYGRSIKDEAGAR